MAMKVGMIQSNYLPWRGYFDFIDDVDLFIFYDDVQYTPRNWRNRNRIKTPAGAQWLTVPVIHGRDTLIQAARIDYSKRWVEKHIKTIEGAYNKAPHFTEYAEELFDLLRLPAATISELNIRLCRWLMQQFGIKTDLKKSADFDIAGDKYNRPLHILRTIGATGYLSGPAARPYTDPVLFHDAGIALEFKSYDYPPYPQLHGEFVPDVSAIDLLFNCGPESRRFLKSRMPNEKVV